MPFASGRRATWLSLGRTTLRHSERFEYLDRKVHFWIGFDVLAPLGSSWRCFLAPFARSRIERLDSEVTMLSLHAVKALEIVENAHFRRDAGLDPRTDRECDLVQSQHLEWICQGNDEPLAFPQRKRNREMTLRKPRRQKFDGGRIDLIEVLLQCSWNSRLPPQAARQGIKVDVAHFDQVGTQSTTIEHLRPQGGLQLLDGD